MPRALLVVIALAFLPRAAWAQGQPLGPEFRVNTFLPDHQYGSSVAAGSSGNFVVVWTSYLQDGSSGGVFGQRYAASGAPLGPEFRVNTFTTERQGDPSVASDSVGNFVVVWTSYTQDGFISSIFGQRYASSGAPLGPEFRVNTYTTDDYQVHPSVASDSAGAFVVVWQRGGSYYPAVPKDIYGQRYASSGAPLGPEFRVNTVTTGSQSSPSVDSDASGNFVVVWDGMPGVLGDVSGQRYASSGAPVGPEFRVNAYTSYAQILPVVAADSAGNFVVVWTSFIQDGSVLGVFGQRYASAGTAIGPEFRVNTYTTDIQWYPSVTADSAGNFVVVWDSSGQDGSNVGVFGQRYAASGVPLGPEFRVNTFTTNNQMRPSVAADVSTGNFVVAWESFAQDGSYTGVFGQRYSQIVPVELMRFGVE